MRTKVALLGVQVRVQGRNRHLNAGLPHGAHLPGNLTPEGPLLGRQVQGAGSPRNRFLELDLLLACLRDHGLITHLYASYRFLGTAS